MFSMLKKQLVITYTLLTWIILTIIIAVSLVISESQLNQRGIETFNSLQNQLHYRLQSKTSLEDTWLAQLEYSNKLIIHVEDNGKPIYFSGVWSPAIDRAALIGHVKSLALEEGINTTINPVSSSLVNSSVFKFKMDGTDPYYASVSILPTTSGFKSLVLLKNTPEESRQIQLQRFLLFSIDVIGLILLFVVNWIFIGKFITPVEQSRKKQTAFVAAVSHELRSPLTVIQTSASALQYDYPSEYDLEKNKHFINGIISECSRMGRLIDDMLILANADAKNWTILTEKVETDTLVIEVYEMFQQVCRQKKQQIHAELPDCALPVITGDKQRLQQVLFILLDNAVSYTPEGGNIVVRIKQKNNTLLIEVADNGPGIANEQKEQIFDRFHRGDQSRNDKTHFGLGLSIASELVALHNGKLYCVDTPGGGGTFIAELKIRKE